MKNNQKYTGQWEIVCRKPIQVTDLEKFNSLSTIQIDKPSLNYKTFNLIKDTTDFPEIEKLLFSGETKWKEEWYNLVVNAGLDYALDVALSNGTQISTWYIGLINGSPTIAAGDTISSHAGWTENTNYDEANRVTWSDAGVSSGSATNSASAASFTCNADSQTIAGAFLVSDNTKGGTSGTLYAAGSFSSSKALDDNETLSITATFTTADDGV